MTSLLALGVLLGATAVPSPAQLMAPQSAPLPYVGNAGLPSGLTISGSGEASAPADEAELTLRISSRPPGNGITQATLQPIVDALVRAGVERASIDTPIYLAPAASHANMASITATIQHPTQAMLAQGVMIVGAAFAQEPNLYLDSAMVRLTLTHCAPTAARARSRAIAHASADARATVTALGDVHLGEVLGATVTYNGPETANGSCNTFLAIPYGNDASQASDLRVHVTSNVTLRYAIK